MQVAEVAMKWSRLEPQSEKQELYLKVQALLLPGFMNGKVYDMGCVKCRSNVKAN